MKEQKIKNLMKKFQNLLKKKNLNSIKNEIEILDSYNLAQLFKHLSNNDRKKIFSLLNDSIASEILVHLDSHFRNNLLKELDLTRLTNISKNIESDDLVDLLSELPKTLAYQILEKLDEPYNKLKELLLYPADTAGGLMAKEYLSVYENTKVDDAILEIRSQAKRIKKIYYVFVVNMNQVLVGILSLKQLIIAPGNTLINKLMNSKVISVNVMLSQEKIINIAKQYDLPAIPVVDENDILVGRITFDDIMDIVDEKTTKDIRQMAGLGNLTGIFNHSFYRLSLVRLPWLLIGLVGGILAAFIIGLFKISLSNTIVLSFFTPIIMSMGGNIGIQSSTIIVRGLATGEIGFFEFYKILFKEIRITLLNSFICSILLFLIVFFWKGLNLGISLFISLFIIMNIGAILGSLIPFILKKYHIEPAFATGPFISILNDIIALIIYFSLVSIIFNF